MKCAQLRESILGDHGAPTIKEKILDLLTQIEKESQKIVGILPDGSASPTKGKSPKKLPSNTGQAIAMQDDTGDELQHMQTPFGARGSVIGGGGMDDDDSDGVEYLREQMLIQAQRMV
jgi:hypothetical protein